MDLGKMGAALLGAALVWPGCASQKSNLDRASAPAAAPARAASATPVRTEPGAEMTARDVDNVRRFLCGRAREQLELLESEMERIAQRLEDEGTDEQRAEWGPVLIGIEHDRQILAAGLLEAERAPLEDWAEVHAILPSMIDIFMLFGAQAMTEIERDLDALAVPARATSGRPRGV